jgi:methylmalonyl-CoA/ethylmalonyl-CoA epimerase
VRIGALDHVAIAVPSIALALPFYTETLGLRAGVPHPLPDQAVRAVFVETAGGRLELIEPTDVSSGVARFLAERGRATLHHVCYAVADLEAALAELAADGVELIDRAPRPGLDGRVAFVHPRASGGVLVELVERAAPRHTGP